MPICSTLQSSISQIWSQTTAWIFQLSHATTATLATNTTRTIEFTTMMLQRQLLPNPRRPVHAFDSSGDPRSGNASKSSPFHNDNNEQLQGHPRRNTRNTSRRTRRRVRLACGACRTRKSRCDGSDPTCGGCRVHETECVYLPWKSRATVSQE